MRGLTEFETVTLTFPPTGGNVNYVSADCYVLAFGRRTIALEAVDKRQVLRLPPIWPKVLMSFDRAKALLAVRGQVMPGERLGDLRFVLDAGPFGPAPRGPSRVPSEGPVAITAAERTVVGEVREITAVGQLTVACELATRTGEEVSLRFRLASIEHTDVEATVLENVAGLVTLELGGEGATAVRNLLAAAVIAYNRAALRRRQRPPLETLPEF